MVLSIDIETYSNTNLTKMGLYKYIDDPSFKILLFAYAFNDEEVKIVDLANGEILPVEVLDALKSESVIKSAYNAQFEKACIEKYFSVKTLNWECTKIKAAMFGYSGSLDSVGKALNLKEDAQKMFIGKSLIRLFSVPRKPTKNNPLTVYTKKEKPEEWEAFKEYCIRDVVAEREIKKVLDAFSDIPNMEKELYQLDLKINARGVRIDTLLAERAGEIDAGLKEKLEKEYLQITGLDTPRKLAAFKGWILDKSGEEVDSITKQNTEELKEKFALAYPEIVRALEIRASLSKSSVAKYQKMLDTVNSDGRSRGLFQFYGANKTGRWAGRLIQLQNLPQNHIKELDLAREIVKAGDYDYLTMMYPSPSRILSELIRTAIVPDKGNVFIVSDFSAIEARVIAWLAEEKWRLDVFNTHGKIYEASASQMFKVPLESIKKGDPLRQKGKVAELALGYQGGTGALISMGALNMGLTEEELPGIVSKWRDSNKKIVSLWNLLDSAAHDAISEAATTIINNKVQVYRHKGALIIQLPSNRRLVYPKAEIKDHHKFDYGTEIVFKDLTKKGLVDTYTYGGKLTENVIQAIARDCLAVAMLRLDKKGYDIVGHVHDEVIIEVKKEDAEKALEDVTKVMSKSIEWAKGLPLRADGYICQYYQKD